MLNVVGKLKAGVTIEQARAELETIRARAAVANPEYPGNRLPTFASAAIGLAITAFTASLVPALRAARIDPSETLR